MENRNRNERDSWRGDHLEGPDRKTCSIFLSAAYCFSIGVGDRSAILSIGHNPERHMSRSTKRAWDWGLQVYE